MLISLKGENKKVDFEDLTDFEDYLSEFNSNIFFDSETCPVCGIKFSDSKSTNQIPLIEIQFQDESIAKNAVKLLRDKGIKSKISVSGKDRLLIAETNLEQAKSILK